MANDPIAVAIDITEQLTQVLEQENGLLRTRQVTQIAGLVPEKGRLGQQLQQAMDSVRRNRPLLEIASRQQRERMQRAAERFHAALEENGRRLGAIKKVAEGLVRAVADEVQRQSTPLRNYGQAGQIAPRHAGPATLALNQVV